MYTPVVMDHFEKPRNSGKPPAFNRVGLSGDPAAGPFMIFYLNVVDGRIRGIGFQTYGCGASIAAGSILSELAAGKTAGEARNIRGDSILKVMGDLPLGKLHCIDTAIAALAHALRAETPGEGEGARPSAR